MPGLWLSRAITSRMPGWLVRCRPLSSVAVDATKPSRVRNIGIIAHIDAGKTTLTERMLYDSGYLKKLGSVDDGTTVTDFLASERKRGITIQSACIPIHWMGFCINLIDTPGHVDFTIEVERSLVVLDGAVCVIDGVAGVEAQTETVWEQANRYSLPRIIFINKMDREGSKILGSTMQSIRERLPGAGKPLLLQWPVLKQEGGFPNREGRGGKQLQGIADLVSLKLTNSTGGPMSLEEGKSIAGSEFAKDLARLREDLVEQLAECDEELLEKLLQLDMDYGKLCAKEIRAAITRATKSGSIVPVLLGSAYRNVGVSSLMQAVVDYLPEPTVRGTEKDNAVAYAFKVVHDARRAPLVFLRVYSGQLTAKMNVLNLNSLKKERIHRIVHVYADDYRDLSLASPGSIVAAYGLQATRTGDTVALMQNSQSPIPEKLCEIPIPPPVFICGIEPASRSETKSLVAAMSMLQLEDPSLHFTQDAETEQFLLSGMGELHLQIVQERLLQIGVKCTFGPVRIHYRESLSFNKSDRYIERIQVDELTDGKRIKLGMELQLQPLNANDCVITSDKNLIDVCFDPRHIVKIQGTNSDGKDAFIGLSGDYPSFDEIKATVELSLSDYVTKSGGPLLHAPLTNLCVSVTKLELYSSDTCSLAAIGEVTKRLLKRALRRGVPENLAQAVGLTAHDGSTVRSIILEPLMLTKLTLPSKSIGAVTQDLSGQRRATILDVHNSEGSGEFAMKRSQVVATLPLSKMLGFSTHLRSLTGGAGAFVMQFKGYTAVPDGEAEAIVRERHAAVKPSQ